MMKLLYVTLCSALITQQAIAAASLDGFSRHYASRCGAPTAKIDSERALPAKFRSRNFPIILEHTTLHDIQQQFKGEIQRNDREEWLCYHSQAENLNWWFISRTSIEHGNLSTIMLSAIDYKAHCNVPARPIYLSGVIVPTLGATRSEVAHYFKSPVPTRATCQQFETHIQSKDAITTNYLRYFFKDNQVTGMSFEQLTTND